MIISEPLRGMGHIRTVIGNTVEDLTCALIPDSRRHKTDSRADYCPDVSANGRYYETKAVGRSREAFVYSGRLKKDRQFVDDGNQLDYVIWHHKVAVAGIQTVEELSSAIIGNIVSAYIIPFDDFWFLCQWLPVEKLNSKYGKHQTEPSTYGTGYRINLTWLDNYRLADGALMRFMATRI